jgi:SAM-dependent methyltransferase
MKTKILNFLFAVRAILMRRLYSKNTYFLAAKSIKPLSRKFGFDRGTPIDRFWIESFLSTNKDLIRGDCLEVGDNRYTKKYGHSIGVSDILDINPRNKKATVISDIRNLKNVKSKSYDTIILTHVLGMVDDYNSAISECRRVLKRRGCLLVTVCSFGSLASGKDMNFWRFTEASARYVFSKYFSDIHITSYGNVLTGQAFWVGLSQEELTQEELTYNDPFYPCVIGIVAIK